MWVSFRRLTLCQTQYNFFEEYEKLVWRREKNGRKWCGVGRMVVLKCGIRCDKVTTIADLLKKLWTRSKDQRQSHITHNYTALFGAWNDIICTWYSGSTSGRGFTPSTWLSIISLHYSEPTQKLWICFGGKDKSIIIRSNRTMWSLYKKRAMHTAEKTFSVVSNNKVSKYSMNSVRQEHSMRANKRLYFVC